MHTLHLNFSMEKGFEGGRILNVVTGCRKGEQDVDGRTTLKWKQRKLRVGEIKNQFKMPCCGKKGVLGHLHNIDAALLSFVLPVLCESAFCEGFLPSI